MIFLPHVYENSIVPFFSTLVENGRTSDSNIVTVKRCTVKDMEQCILLNGNSDTLLPAFDQPETNTNVQLKKSTRVSGMLQILPSDVPGKAKIGPSMRHLLSNIEVLAAVLFALLCALWKTWDTTLRLLTYLKIV